MTTTKKFYTADEIKEDATSRIKEDDTSVTTYSYPVGVIWQGNEDETVVSVDVTAEKTGPQSKEPHVFFETLESNPLQTFIDGEHGDYGSPFMENAVRVAREWWSTEELLMQAGVKYDVVDFDGELFFFFDEEKARDDIEETIVDAFNDTLGAEIDPQPSSLSEIEQLGF